MIVVCSSDGAPARITKDLAVGLKVFEGLWFRVWALGFGVYHKCTGNPGAKY